MFVMGYLSKFIIYWKEMFNQNGYWEKMFREVFSLQACIVSMVYVLLCIQADQSNMLLQYLSPSAVRCTGVRSSRL